RPIQFDVVIPFDEEYQAIVSDPAGESHEELRVPARDLLQLPDRLVVVSLQTKRSLLRRDAPPQSADVARLAEVREHAAPFLKLIVSRRRRDPEEVEGVPIEHQERTSSLLVLDQLRELSIRE